MKDFQLRNWVEANPGRVNDRDQDGRTPLYCAVTISGDYARTYTPLQLALWLMDEKGADVNTKALRGETPLHATSSHDIFNALLARGADPNSRRDDGSTPLMDHAVNNRVTLVTRLLEDPRVQAAINVQNSNGDTALHFACYKGDAIVHHLIEANAYARATNKYGNTPLAWLRKYRLPRPAAYAVLEQALIAAEERSKKNWLLVKAHQLLNFVASSPTTMPPCLQGRLERGEPLPGVALMPAAVGQTEEEDEEARKFHSTMALLLGTQRDLFKEVLEFFKKS